MVHPHQTSNEMDTKYIIIIIIIIVQNPNKKQELMIHQT